jgi:hypothetical protein
VPRVMITPEAGDADDTADFFNDAELRQKLVDDFQRVRVSDPSPVTLDEVQQDALELAMRSENILSPAWAVRENRCC